MRDSLSLPMLLFLGGRFHKSTHFPNFSTKAEVELGPGEQQRWYLIADAFILNAEVQLRNSGEALGPAKIILSSVARRHLVNCL